VIRAHKLIDYMNQLGERVPPNKRYAFVHSDIAAFMSKSIERAGKFQLGTFGGEDLKVLTNTGIEQLKEGILSVPYPYTYYEVTIVPDDGDRINLSMIIVPMDAYLTHPAGDAKEVDLILGLVGESSVLNLELTHLLVYFHVVPLGLMMDPMFVTFGLLNDTVELRCIANPFTPDAELESANNDVSYCEGLMCQVSNLLSLSQALLTANGVEVVIEKAPERLNKQRVKSGRVPLFDHHIVKIGGVSSCGNIIGKGMERASPRKHWRRGHVRTYHRGEVNEFRAPIPASLINGRGFISKEYEA